MQRGDFAPDFALPDERGQMRSLKELTDSASVVLFFYPAAMSKGCTAESCHFRDLAGEFAALHAVPVGISRDTKEKQNAFSTKYQLGFPVLSDEDGTVAMTYGVFRKFRPLGVRRWTFVIGQDRRIIDIIKSEVSMNRHADRALAALANESPLSPEAR